MSNDPTPATTDDLAEVLRAFGGPGLNQTTADRLLSFWKGYDELTSEQIDEITAAFPPDEPGPDQPPERMYSYPPMFLLGDVIAVLKMHGVDVQMSGAEKIRKPAKAARDLLRSLHIQPKATAFPKVYWLRDTFGKQLLPIRPVAD